MKKSKAFVAPREGNLKPSGGFMQDHRAAIECKITDVDYELYKLRNACKNLNEDSYERITEQLNTICMLLRAINNLD